jgi:tRNA(fMet)-specific endonuclease VapC
MLRSRSHRQLEPLLNRLILESELLLVDDVTTRHYAVVREGLRRKGRPLPEHDVWIAALAIQYRLELASRDAHFDQIAGLARHGW